MRGQKPIKRSKSVAGKKQTGTNPYREYTPGFFIPVYSVDKTKVAKEREDQQNLDVFDHIETKSYYTDKSSTDLPMSECSFKVLNRNKACSRRLETRMKELEINQQRCRRENETESLLLHSEHTLLTKRRSKSLKEVQIPAWRYSDICMCATSEPKLCPRHWREHEKSRQHERKEHTMFGLKTESEEKLYESFPITRISTPRLKKLPKPVPKTIDYLG